MYPGKEKPLNLGILVTTDRYQEALIGITRTAAARGHDVTIFFTDTGTSFVNVPEITDLASVSGVKMAYCELNAKEAGVIRDKVPERIVNGSQLNNALMFHNADKIISL